MLKQVMGGRPEGLVSQALPIGVLRETQCRECGWQDTRYCRSLRSKAQVFVCLFSKHQWIASWLHTILVPVGRKGPSYGAYSLAKSVATYTVCHMVVSEGKTKQRRGRRSLVGGSPDFKHQEASSIRWLLSPNLKGVSPVGGGGQMAQGKAAAYTKALRNESEETNKLEEQEEMQSEMQSEGWKMLWIQNPGTGLGAEERCRRTQGCLPTMRGAQASELRLRDFGGPPFPKIPAGVRSVLWHKP